MPLSPELLLDARATLGEGPVWLDRARRLLWVDIDAPALHVTDVAAARDHVVAVHEQVGCAVPACGSLVLAGLRSGFWAVDLDTGSRAHIDDPEPDLPGNRFNDGKCDPRGRFWAGTMECEEKSRTGALYSLDATLRVRKWLTGIGCSNGLAWSDDAKTMYYVDSPTRKVVAFEYDIDEGSITNPRDAFVVPDGWGFPDGMTIDTDGCLWIALWDGARIVRVDPGSGRIVEEVDMPVSRPTSCAFGGDGYGTLFITSARTRLSEEQLAREPHAGSVFAVRPSCGGLPAVEFAGADRLPGVLGRG
jgi:sugar lactone lactonase YvrE